jgi:hypothetical protein
MQNQQLYPQAGQDLSALAGQLAWLVVSNIAHHALAPMGKEISMIHQLNDLKRAIRPRDHAHGAGLSTVSGSTSPFVSYLDQRDRGHATPVGGALTPTSSFTSAGSTSAYLKWMHTPEWTSYVVFLDKWCEEIFYILGRGTTLATAEEEVEESPSARIRKKRLVADQVCCLVSLSATPSFSFSGCFTELTLTLLFFICDCAGSDCARGSSGFSRPRRFKTSSRRSLCSLRGPRSSRVVQILV